MCSLHTGSDCAAKLIQIASVQRLSLIEEVIQSDRPAMSVSRRKHDIGGWYSRSALDRGAYAIRKLTRYTQNVNTDESNFRGAIIEHQSSRVKIIMYTRRNSFASVKTGEWTAEIRCDDF